MSVLVKISALTRVEDVEAAVTAGADYLGFAFRDGSDDERTRVADLAMSARERGFEGGIVGVFGDWDLEALAAAAGACDLDVLELEAGASDALVRAASELRPVWRRVRVRSGVPADLEAACGRAVEAIVLDVGPAAGGRADPLVPDAARIRALSRARHVVISGALDAAGVGEIVHAFAPYAVDAASGLGADPNRVDPAALAAFLDAVRRADEDG